MSAATTLGLADAGVPGVALIADGDALRSRLAEAGEDLTDRGYVRYKPGTSLVAALRLASGPAFAYAVGAAARPKLAKIVDRAPAGALVLTALDDGLLIARPAADRDLPALADVRRLARLSPAGSDPRDWSTFAYKPQRRWVGRALDDPAAPVLRAYRPRELSGVLTGWQLAAQVRRERPDLLLPGLRGVAERHGLIAVDWLPGQPLDRLLAADGATAGDLVAVGAALARLHDALQRPQRQPGSDPGRAAAAVVRELGTVLPRLRGRAAGLVRRLMARRPAACWLHPVHGDFSADQVIIDSGSSVAIADWDRAGWGDPAADLGSLRATGLGDDGWESVLDGYRGIRPLPPATDWYAVLAGMLRLTEPLRTCRPDWRSAIADRLTDLEHRATFLGEPGDRLRSAR